MITLIVPTRNRCHTLAIVGASFYQLRLVSEIIFVLDAATDGSSEYLAQLAADHPCKKTLIVQNEHRIGAAGCRMRGVSTATNELVLFCDDDLFLEPGYDEVCLRKLHETGAGAVSGRHLFRLPGEAPNTAIARFGNGSRRTAPFNRLLCEVVPEAYYEGDIEIPLTNACILTKKSLLQRYGFDPFYRSGNGYREESDFQMNMFVNNYSIRVTNEAHAVHLHRSEVRTGGNRVNRIARIYWAVYYTSYFYRKYWNRYAGRVGLRCPRTVALLIFAVWVAYATLLRPLRHMVPATGPSLSPRSPPAHGRRGDSQQRKEAPRI
ncbi:MAG: glycosyltransferase family 2 protein [Alphaproteobacteria bacterium]|nr:glycosyltransferase family 2 protein [Alphaproteobacteria bacterium]